MAGSSEKKILIREGNGYYEEKKSRFLSEAFHVCSEEEVAEILEKIRKEHYDASHHCYAYMIGEDGRMTRAADDGEPGGTAGMPILEVIRGEELRDTLIVVTRYFGGTLLGTGGLTRAYREAAKDAVRNSETSLLYKGIRSAFSVPYTEQGKIKYLFRENGWYILSTAYTAEVSFVVLVPEEDRGRAEALLKEKTGGKIGLSSSTICQYIVADGRAIIFNEDQ